jgi:hypothetical protein
MIQLVLTLVIVPLLVGVAASWLDDLRREWWRLLRPRSLFKPITPDDLR